jgi:hypothetical protein
MRVAIFVIIVFVFMSVAVFITVPPMHDRAANVLERQEQELANRKERAERRIEHMWRGIGDGR